MFFLPARLGPWHFSRCLASHRPAHAKMLTNAVWQAASGNVGLPDRPFRPPKRAVWGCGTACFALRNGRCGKPLAHR